MSALPGQQRPRAPDAGSLVGTTILSLSIAIMVVTTPAWSEWCFHFQYGVDHFQRILDQRIAAWPNAVPNQFKKSGVNNLPGGELRLRERRTIANRYDASIRIFVRLRVSNLYGVDTNEVTTNTRNERSFRGHSPRFDVT